MIKELIAVTTACWTAAPPSDINYDRHISHNRTQQEAKKKVKTKKKHTQSAESRKQNRRSN